MTDNGIWAIRAGSGGAYATDFEQAGVAAIGFVEAGDVTGMDREAIRQRIQ